MLSLSTRRCIQSGSKSRAFATQVEAAKVLLRVPHSAAQTGRGEIRKALDGAEGLIGRELFYDTKSPYVHLKFRTAGDAKRFTRNPPSVNGTALKAKQVQEATPNAGLYMFLSL